jgi:ADP-heptose:LPS heptosyltransferase
LKKVLIIRFSSIGDIVLTSPVVRCLKLQAPDVEVHYLTKESFLPVIKANPYIDKIYTIRKEISEVIPALKAEQYDHIIDLHKNIRSIGILLKLGRPFSTFTKLNIRKFLFCKLKINLLPDIHIVDRYLAALKGYGVKNDGQGLDFFIPPADEVVPPATAYVALVIGGKHATKQMPVEKLTDLCKMIPGPILILGGPEDKATGDLIIQNTEAGNEQCTPRIINTCGTMNINQSASLIRQADRVITHDTGLMHVAAAFRKDIVSIWGNTVPAFGMYPYFPSDYKGHSQIAEVTGLSCRPCSRLGYPACPKGHFKCMNDIKLPSVVPA